MELLFMQQIFNEPALCASYCTSNGETGVKELTPDFRGFNSPDAEFS